MSRTTKRLLLIGGLLGAYVLYERLTAVEERQDKIVGILEDHENLIGTLWTGEATPRATAMSHTELFDSMR